MEGEVDRVAGGVNAVVLEDDQLPRMRVSELREELRRRHLRVTGRKPELLARLRAALLLERERIADDEEEVDSDADEDEDEEDEPVEPVNNLGLRTLGGHKDVRPLNSIIGNRSSLCNDDDDDYNDDDDDNRERIHNNTPVVLRRNESQCVLLTFKDVEGSLEKFSGDGHYNVQRWLDDFEEMALLCGWNDVQKVVYAKRLLCGSAKLFVEYERCARSWSKLKKALRNEFEETVDSLQIHRQLSKLKKKQDETYQEYTYRMLWIAAQANIDVLTVIQYIIEGIPDDAANKSILYGAKNVKQ